MNSGSMKILGECFSPPARSSTAAIGRQLAVRHPKPLLIRIPNLAKHIAYARMARIVIHHPHDFMKSARSFLFYQESPHTSHAFVFRLQRMIQGASELTIRSNQFPFPLLNRAKGIPRPQGGHRHGGAVPKRYIEYKLLRYMGTHHSGGMAADAL